MKGQISNSQELSPLIFQALNIYSHVFYFYFSPWTQWPKVMELGSVTDNRPGPAHRMEFPVPRVFFQKIYGFRAGISCSQSFLLKDLWFRSSGTGRPGWHTVCRGPKTQVTFKTVPPILYLLSPES